MDVIDGSLEEQPLRLAKELDHWLELFDGDLALQDVKLTDRPIRALLEILRAGGVEVCAGKITIDTSTPADCLAEPWFAALYTGVEKWYVDRYGSEALRARGNPPLEGVVLVRNTPFRLRMPAHRSEVHVEGREAWIYFEDGVGPGENPRNWLYEGPNLNGLSVEQQAEVDAELLTVSTALRAINFRMLGAGADEVAAGLGRAVRAYLESAARRIHDAETKALAFAWFDLQMAAESGLKLVQLRATGNYQRIHLLAELLKTAKSVGVDFDETRLAAWPEFKPMSDYRYGQGDPGGVAELIEAYHLTLDLLTAALGALTPPFQPGASFLVRRPPWQTGGVSAGGGD